MSHEIDFDDLPAGAHISRTTSGVAMVRVNPDGTPWQQSQIAPPHFIPSAERTAPKAPALTVRQQREALDRQLIEQKRRDGELQVFRGSHQSFGGK